MGFKVVHFQLRLTHICKHKVTFQVKYAMLSTHPPPSSTTLDNRRLLRGLCRAYGRDLPRSAGPHAHWAFAHSHPHPHHRVHVIRGGVLL